jgi:hypothetical protein
MVISVNCCLLWWGVVRGQEAPKAKEEPKPIEILAEDLAREHAADPEKTWDKYRGKQLQVTGKVLSVFDDILYLQTTVEFKDRELRVSISYRKGTKPAVKAGEQATFVGKYDRAGVFGPAVVDCDLAKAPGTAKPAINPKDIKVTVKDNQFFLQEEKLTFPGELEPVAKLLGKPSRVVKNVFQYHVWDELGIAAKQNTFRENKITVGVQLTLKLTDDEECPKKPFTGKLTVEGTAISADTDIAALGKPFAQWSDFPIWRITDQKAMVLFTTMDKKGKGVKVFLYEQLKP